MLLAAAMIMILGMQRRAVANAKRSALLALFKCHYFIKLILTLKFFHQFRSFHRTPISIYEFRVEFFVSFEWKTFKQEEPHTKKNDLFNF